MLTVLQVIVTANDQNGMNAIYCMHFKAKEHILTSIQNLSKSSLQHGSSLQKVFNRRHEL